MNVSMRLLSHPSYRLLRQKVGPIAAEVLLALWTEVERVRCHRLVPPEYIEAIADWRGTPGTLLEALFETDWVRLDEDGIVFMTNAWFVQFREYPNFLQVFPPACVPKAQSRPSK